MKFPQLFVNYFRDRVRPLPINIAVARIVLVGYLIWKTIWYDWQQFFATPYIGYESYAFAIPPSPAILVIEKWVLIGLLIAVALGYRLGATTFLSALLVAHLATVRFTLNTSGGTTALFFASYFLIMFGLYRNQDVLSIDYFRQEGYSISRRGVSKVLNRTQASNNDFKMGSLQWSLTILALTYFASGFDKVLQGGIEWIAPENLSRLLLVYNTPMLYSHPIPIGAEMLQYPFLVSLAAVGTLVLELGLLVAVLAGLPITIIIIGIIGMHTIIGLAMGPFFSDVFFFLAMFVSWDSFYLYAKHITK